MAKRIYLLHQLVHSLTPAEKRHFKLSITIQSKQPNYVKLFNILEEESDTGTGFRDKIKRSGFNITYESEQLQKMLTRSLREYHEDATSGIQILHAIASIEALYAKQQYDYCESLIDEYLDEAKKREKFALVLDLLAWKRRLIVRRPDTTTIQEKHAKICADETAYTQKIQNLSIYKDIQVQLTKLTIQKGTVITEDEQEVYHNIMKHPLLSDVSFALSFEASTIYHNAWIRYYSNTIQLEKALHMASTFLEVYENNKTAVLYQTQAYFVAMANVMNRSIQIGKYDQALFVLDKITALKDMKGIRRSEQLENDIVNVSALHPMIIYNLQKKHTKTIETYYKWKNVIESGKYIFDTDNFWKFYHLLVARAFLYIKEYNAAIEHVHIIMNKYDNRKKLDVMLCVYLLNILIHYEIGNYQSIPYLIQSTKRFAAANQFKQSVLAKYFKMITRLVNAPTANERTLIYESYYPTYVSNDLLPDDKTIIDSLDLDFWITQKTGRNWEVS